MDERRRVLEREARRLGFSEVRIAAVSPTPRIAAYADWLELGFHGEMSWMATGLDPRRDPRELLPSCRSVVVLAVDYGHEAPPDPGGLTGRVSRYAWGRDYHNAVGKRLRNLQRRLREHWPGLRSRTFVDNGPVLERAWAEQSGLGFIGKNNMVILPGQTSYFFLGVLLVDQELPPDLPITVDHCGTCARCIERCPTSAFPAPHSLDARRCISYLTIENTGEIPEELRPLLGRWLFGCDACQDPCPHVRLGRRPAHPDFAPVNAWLDLPALLDSSDDALIQRFEGTPLRRAAPWRLRRNALVVLGNLGDPAAIPVLLRYEAGSDPVLSQHARWALGELDRAPDAARR